MIREAGQTGKCRAVRQHGTAPMGPGAGAWASLRETRWRPVLLAKTVLMDTAAEIISAQHHRAAHLVQT